MRYFHWDADGLWEGESGNVCYRSEVDALIATKDQQIKELVGFIREQYRSDNLRSWQAHMEADRILAKYQRGRE